MRAKARRLRNLGVEVRIPFERANKPHISITYDGGGDMQINGASYVRAMSAKSAPRDARSGWMTFWVAPTWGRLTGGLGWAGAVLFQTGVPC